ncbi:MAG: hypothetical protein JWN39_2679 [Ilumatobacteraceae bacterium]|nr:hypothetical protein [Ilumatobacteraceae bacterium]
MLLRQIITRLVMGVALLCASFAWSGWVFLHSVGDPHRAERIANSILDSPAARAEIAAPIADQIVQNFALPASDKTAIANTVADVLGDPTIISNFIAAFGSAQANALGVNDPRPTTINAGALINAVRDRLAASQPELAALIPDSTASIDLPKVQSPVIARVRSIANTWTIYLALLAVALIMGVMVLGDRRRALRSYGFWAIFTGAFWAIGPRLAPWFAHQTAPNADAVVGATVDAVAGPITMAATILVVSGIAALVVRYTVMADRHQPDPYGNAYAPYAADPYAGAVVGQQTVLQPVLGGHVPSAGFARTDQVPVQPGGPYSQPTYSQPASAQPEYAQPQYAQPQYAQQAAFAQQTWAPQYPPTGQQPVTADAGPAPRSTQIPESQDDLPRHDTAIPLLIRPLDLPTSSDLLFPGNQPAPGADSH